LAALALGALWGYDGATGRLSSAQTAQAQKQKEAISVTIRLPADAVLWINDYKTETTGPVRTFQTPPLPMGGHFAYTLKAMSGGKEVTRKIHLAHGVNNGFDLRAEFLPAAQVGAHPKDFNTAAAAGGQAAAPAGSPAATQSPKSKYLPFPTFPEVKFGGKIGIDFPDSKRYWPPRVVPPKGAPNILLIMTDDVGFGAPSTFGGVIPTPALDRVAKMGLRFNKVHSTALCSPTRAALITGRNHHTCHFGNVSEMSTGFPG
jgi:uncharacterized protein (TIGR03000 family)